MDEQQVIEDALEVLREIMRESPDPHLSLLAGAMSLHVRGPILNMRFKDGEGQPSPDELKRRYAEAMRKSPKEFAEVAGKEVEKRKGPAYKTRVFKCLEDFENCKKHGVSPNACLALMILCIGQQLIPFTK